MSTNIGRNLQVLSKGIETYNNLHLFQSCPDKKGSTDILVMQLKMRRTSRHKKRHLAGSDISWLPNDSLDPLKRPWTCLDHKEFASEINFNHAPYYYNRVWLANLHLLLIELYQSNVGLLLVAASQFLWYSWILPLSSWMALHLVPTLEVRALEFMLFRYSPMTNCPSEACFCSHSEQPCAHL